ncbi:MAG: cytochrome c3 family protein, partial [Anaerolineae bacterium]|nr:cytochrome c3 family protein [Anaerolineae bacterium]
MMRHHFLLLSLAVAAPGCIGPEPDEAHPLAAEVLLLAPPELGRLERPAVAFAHDRHTRVLGQQSCQACHPTDARRRLSLRFGRLEEPASRSKLLELYHDRCLACHQQRTAQKLSSGPVTCGECHRRSGP